MTVVVTLATSFAFGLAGTWSARWLALRLDFLNHPNPIGAQHTKPVAYLGGVGLGIGVLGGVCLDWIGVFGYQWLHQPGLLLGALAFLTIGVLDDRFAFAPRSKFLLQLVAVTIVLTLGAGATLTHILPVDLFLSGLWILTLVNAVNFTDVCDGLVGGLAVVAFLALSFLIPELQAPSLAIAGAAAGFLVLNRPPASIFLGDAGSHLVGFLLAALTLRGISLRPEPSMLAAALLIAGVPLFEGVFITFMRIRKGLSWWKGSPDHFALRLQARGLSRWQVDLLAWTVGAGLGAVALLLTHVGALFQMGLMLGVGVLLLLAGLLLSHWEVSPPHRAQGRIS
jgi:UDP-GlcNAc:undecaprenyl-phosphate GlcNAc-1-phosphate transferase